MRDKEVALISRLFSRWSIRRKLLFCLAIALVIVGALAELPLAGNLSKSLGDLRVTLSKIQQARQFSISGMEGKLLADEFPSKLGAVEDALTRYRRQLEADLDTDIRFGDRSYERKTIATLEESLKPAWFHTRSV